MFGRGHFGIMTVVSIMVAIAFAYSYVTNRPPSSGEDWELIAEWGHIDLGQTKMVYVALERCYDEQFLARVLDDLIGNAYRAHRGMVSIYIFDDKEYTPDKIPGPGEQLSGDRFPFTDEQILHFRAEYHYAVTMEDQFYFIEVTDPNTSPPEYERRRAGIHPGFVSSTEYAY